MAKRYYRATSRLNLKKKPTITHGKKFLTKSGRWGCYVYVNGKRSHFESKAPDDKYTRASRRRNR